MKKMIFIAAVTIATAVAFSCQKNEQAPVLAQTELRTFTCTIASEPDSKVSIANDGKTAWEVGDKILVHGKELSTSKVVTLTSSDITDAGKKAIITVDVSGMTAYAPDSYYAAYPAEAYIDSGSDRPYYYSRFNDTNLPLMTAYLDGDNFLFFNLCGVITFSVTGDFDDFIFSGNNDEEVGYDTYQVKVISTDKNYKRAEGTSGPKTTVTGTVTGDGSTIHYIYLPAGVNFTGGFSIKFRKSGAIVKVASTDSAVNVARSNILPLGNITSHLKDYVAPTTHDSDIKPVASATDLGATQTANCYVVDASVSGNAGKIFKFKAVKGNSSTVLSGIESVAIIWETYNNAETVTANTVIAGVDYDLQAEGDPYIVFQMPATLHAGNALIAAKNGADEILWSWHIWVPADDIESKKIAATDFVGASYIMDRNLGALVATSASGDADPLSLGLYYQWGRKDPFPGNSAFSGSTPISVAGEAMTKHNGLITTAYSIEHPTAYAYVYSVDDSDWNEDHPTDLWIPASKSMYDPCPPGYRVPARNDSKPMFMLDDTGWDYSAANRFRYGSIVFPVAGYIDCWGASYANVGARSHVWSANNRGETTAYCMYYRSDQTPKMYASNYSKAKAGSVRCVAE